MGSPAIKDANATGAFLFRLWEVGGRFTAVRTLVVVPFTCRRRFYDANTFNVLSILRVLCANNVFIFFLSFSVSLP